MSIIRFREGGMIKKSKRGREDGGGGSNSMEKVDNRISDLPEGLLQRIVYFLSQEEAVRTSVLSKSWRYIWCTRPNFDFSETNFNGNKHQFLSVVENTLQRYTDPNGLLLDEFRLSINLLGGGGDNQLSDQETVRVLNKWIPIILTTTMGVALKEFCLSIISPQKMYVSKYPCLVYDLLLIDNKKLHFGRLQVLSLRRVLIKQESFDQIISTCTLLTTLRLKECYGFKTIKLDKKLHKYLKHFNFMDDKYQTLEDATISEIEIGDVPTLETIKIVGSKVRLHVGGHEFTNLKSVTLKLPYYFAHNGLCTETDEIYIDAPNLSYFEYTGSIIPSFSFAPNCRWSNIRLVNSDDLCADSLSWLLKLSQLLQALCHSQISLYIHQTHRDIDSICIPQPDLFVNKPVVVKHLEMCYFQIYTISSALNGLLYICRPKRITQPGVRRNHLTKEIEEKKFKEYLRTILIARGSVSQEIRRDLEAVTSQKSETFDKCERWKPIQWAAFLECPQLSGIRFQLKWSEVCHSSSKLRKLVRMLDK